MTYLESTGDCTGDGSRFSGGICPSPLIRLYSPCRQSMSASVASSSSPSLLKASTAGYGMTLFCVRCIPMNLIRQSAGCGFFLCSTSAAPPPMTENVVTRVCGFVTWDLSLTNARVTFGWAICFPRLTVFFSRENRRLPQKTNKPYAIIFAIPRSFLSTTVVCQSLDSCCGSILWVSGSCRNCCRNDYGARRGSGKNG